MGYLRRGLTLQELKKWGRELAKKGGSARDLALMIVEDNYSVSIATTRTKIISESNRLAIRKWARNLPEDELLVFNHYVRLCYNIFNYLVPPVETIFRAFNRNSTIVRYDIRRIAQVEKYCKLANHLSPILKAKKEDGSFSDYEEGVEQDLKDMKEAIGAPYFSSEREDGTIAPLYQRLYAELNFDAGRLRVYLRELLTYQAVVERLCEDKDLEDFIPDYVFDMLNILKEPILNKEDSIYSELNAIREEEKLKQMEKENSPEDLIKEQTKLYLSMRRFAVVPDIDRTREQVKEGKVRAIIMNIQNTSESRNENR